MTRAETIDDNQQQERAAEEELIGELLEGEKSLHLHKRPLPELPGSLLRLTNGLTKLIIYRCDLERLPEDLSLLSNLTHLYVSKNRLLSLPSSIGSLTSLQELSASYNRISILPHQLLALPSLRYLNLNNNPVVWQRFKRRRGEYVLTRCSSNVPSLLEFSRKTLIFSKDVKELVAAKSLPEELCEYLQSPQLHCASCQRLICLSHYKLVIPKNFSALRHIPQVKCEAGGLYAPEENEQTDITEPTTPRERERQNENEDPEDDDDGFEDSRYPSTSVLPFEYNACSLDCATAILHAEHPNAPPLTAPSRR